METIYNTHNAELVFSVVVDTPTHTVEVARFSHELDAVVFTQTFTARNENDGHPVSVFDNRNGDTVNWSSPFAIGGVVAVSGIVGGN